MEIVNKEIVNQYNIFAHGEIVTSCFLALKLANNLHTIVYVVQRMKKQIEIIHHQ